MERAWLVYVLLLAGILTVFAGEKVIRVIPGTPNELEFLSSLEGKEDLEIDFWKAPHKIGLEVDIHVTEPAYKVLSKMLHSENIKFQILIFDVEKMVENERGAQSRAMGGWYSRYHPLKEIEQEMKSLASQSRGMGSVFSVGRSYEKRDMLAVKLEGKPKPNKRTFFMNCGIHAREWVSPATCMYIIKQIVSKYGRDSSVTEMMDKMDFVIMPVLNVDGYVFTWDRSSRRNRFWRKTRKPNPGYPARCTGTDPNRNWDYKWGLPGASSDPCNDAYRGTHPFSEVEVKNVADYLKGLSEQNQIAGYMDIHAYSQLWMTPWGYTKQPSRDHRELMRVSKSAVDAIRSAGYWTYYRYGPSSVIIYQNSGGSKDYTYGKLGIKYCTAPQMIPGPQMIPDRK